MPMHTAAYYFAYCSIFFAIFRMQICNMQNIQKMNPALLFCILFCIQQHIVLHTAAAEQHVI
jgi:hypothetical protein